MLTSRTRIALIMGTALSLSACQMGSFASSFKGHKAGDEAAVETAVPGNSAAAIPSGGERDVEAPEIFNKTDKALWDGRPSLGGVWVAHTSVKDPERVLILNPANGKSVVGALFRREIDNPGPPLQLSSDAAEALGMLAGQPATIKVTALKRVEATAPAPEAAPIAADAAAPKDTTKKPANGSAIDAKPIDPVVDTAAAAIDKATKGKAKTGAAATTAAPVTIPAQPPTAAKSEPAKRAYVQIGIFSVEANAKKAAAQMEKAGMKASVKSDTSQGKTFWRVIIGPVATVAERDALAAKVKALGYPDAYPVSK
jgi:cell division protein FtsN